MPALSSGFCCISHVLYCRQEHGYSLGGAFLAGVAVAFTAGPLVTA